MIGFSVERIRPFVVLALVGLVIGAAMTWGVDRKRGELPVSCDDLIDDAPVGGLLRSVDAPDPVADAADDSLRCRWRALAEPDFEPPRCTVLVLELRQRSLLRPRAAVDRLRADARWTGRATVPGLGTDAVVGSRLDDSGVARAEVRMVDDAFAYALRLRCPRADRGTAGYLAELAARQVSYQGRLP